MSENIEKEEPKKANHIAGCSIFLVILGMVVFLISITIYMYHDMKDAIVSITDEEKKPTKVLSTDDDTKNKALEEKFSAFTADVRAEKKTQIELSIDEINLAIAHFDRLKEFREMMFITDITNEEDTKDRRILANISFPVNEAFLSDGKRYINGTIAMEPVIAMDSLFPIIDDVKPSTGNPVPPKIIRELPVLLFTEYRNDEDLKEIYHKLTKVELRDGKMIVTSDPSTQEIPILDRDVSEEVNVGLQLFILLTFIFISTVLFFLWLKKYKAKQQASE